MKKIEIKFEYDLALGEHYVCVYGYKSKAAYSLPEEHPGECFHCAFIVDLASIKQDATLILERILGIVEQSVNSLLEASKDGCL